jgi:hypothetical protein
MVYADSGDTFYHGNVSGDAEAELVLCESERANLDPWLGDDI